VDQLTRICRTLHTRLCRALLLLAALGIGAHAQTGRISGRVTALGGAPVVGAQVLLSGAGLSAETSDSGTFTIPGVPTGTYELSVFRIGYRPQNLSSITVSADQNARVAIRLDRTIVQLQGVVVAASRHAEKITDAASTITAIDAVALENRIGNSYAPVLRDAPGLDVTQVGVTSTLVNGRGFNVRANSRWLTLEDGRIATLAENGLPVGEHTTIPKLDVSSVEVITGPGSALYGANASSGLLSMQTKDPRQFPGFSTEISGGTRDFYDAQARYAAVAGRWGYKMSAEYQSVHDWTDTLLYPAVKAGGPVLPDTTTDFLTHIARAAGSLDYYFADGARVQFNSGVSLRNGLADGGTTEFQLVNYHYADYQLEYSSAHWFAQTYFTHSNTGDTYRRWLAVPAAAQVPTLSPDSVRALAAFPIDGRLYALEIQNNLLAGALLRTGVSAIDNTRLTWGGQLRQDRVSSYGKVYTDAITGRPILRRDEGAYAQAESPLTGTLRLVVAARYDEDSRYTAQVSPRASVLFTPVADQTVRLTYGEAYRSPTLLQTNIYTPISPTARTVGNATGFIIKDTAGTVVNSIGALEPETNKTWELGYKGVLENRLFVDVTGYHSTFVRFIGAATVVANPFAATPTRAYDKATGALIADASGKPVTVQTFLNVGTGVFDGIDAGLRYYFTEHVAIASTMSFTRLDTIKLNPTDPPDAGQFNTSSDRTSLSLELTDLPKNVGSTATARYVNGYSFRSAQIWGQVPTYAVFDLSANYRISSQATTVMMQVQNLAGCVGGTVAPPPTGIAPGARWTFTRGAACGFGIRHHELIEMPAIGTMLIVGVRREWR
jgi:iron complex outermembrane receptor protein